MSLVLALHSINFRYSQRHCYLLPLSLEADCVTPLKARPVVSLYFTVSPFVSATSVRASQIPFNCAFLSRADPFRAIAALHSSFIENELEKANGMETIRVQ